ncbi:Alpha/Beta hydrolase protein [Mycena sanguinolenta]|nr:Alpha/Beta hydrolase protein [Mycena sanguinolenta]
MKQTLVIGGVDVHIHTADKFATATKPILALFVLHGRLSSSESDSMQPLISGLVDGAAKHQGEKDLMVVAFDHRNHGTRLRNQTANLGFEENANHVHDMWAIQSGTAQDVSFLIDLLEAYLFPTGNRAIIEWGVAGISLGGHSTWMAAAADPRIKLAIPIIGCPDYLKLMEPRAASHGIAMAAPHFPESLLKLIRAKAPTALPYTSVGPENPFLGKKVLVLCGGADPLVPWTASRTFVEGLEVGPMGSKEYIIYDGVGHAVPPPMVEATVSFVLRFCE